MSAFRDEGALETRRTRLDEECAELRAEVEGLEAQVHAARAAVGVGENRDAFLRRLQDEYDELRRAADELATMLDECEADFALIDRDEVLTVNNHRADREMRRARIGK